MGVYGQSGTPITGSPPACRVYHNANQSITNAVVTVVAFNSERYDTDTMHDTATNNSRITIKTAGLYIVTFTAVFAVGTDYTMTDQWFRMNGATPLAVGAKQQSNAGVSASPGLNVTTIYKFAVNDYIEVMVEQRNGVPNARNLAAAGNYSPEFAATWIGLGT